MKASRFFCFITAALSVLAFSSPAAHAQPYLPTAMVECRPVLKPAPLVQGLGGLATPGLFSDITCTIDSRWDIYDKRTNPPTYKGRTKATRESCKVPAGSPSCFVRATVSPDFDLLISNAFSVGDLIITLADMTATVTGGAKTFYWTTPQKTATVERWFPCASTGSAIQRVGFFTPGSDPQSKPDTFPRDAVVHWMHGYSNEGTQMGIVTPLVSCK